MSKEIIKFENVTAGYGKKVILTNLNFTIYDNDFVGVVGPNGAGKTTILKTMIGSLKPISGRITRNNLHIGYVPQRDIVQPLLPYSVFDVVMMGRYSAMGLLGKPSRKDYQFVEESLENVGIGELKDYHYNSLSGGQRQRTLIARALAIQPNILILDEPTNGMDTPSHYSLLELIENLHEIKNLTIILVSHLLSDVAKYAHEIILVEKDFFQYGPKEEILSEGNLKKTYSSDFIVTKLNGELIITSKQKERTEIGNH